MTLYYNESRSTLFTIIFFLSSDLSCRCSIYFASMTEPTLSLISFQILWVDSSAQFMHSTSTGTSGAWSQVILQITSSPSPWSWTEKMPFFCSFFIKKVFSEFFQLYNFSTFKFKKRFLQTILPVPNYQFLQINLLLRPKMGLFSLNFVFSENKEEMLELNFNTWVKSV